MIIFIGWHEGDGSLVEPLKDVALFPRQIKLVLLEKSPEIFGGKVSVCLGPVNVYPVIEIAGPSCMHTRRRGRGM